MASANAQPPVAVSKRASDLDRLETAVRDFAALKESLEAEKAALESSLAESLSRLDEVSTTNRELQERLIAEGQRRHDAVKRIDDLVARTAQLDPSASARGR